MPLKRREMSNLPESVGGRVAAADGVAVGEGDAGSISSACVIVQRQRSSEIQRNVIATKSAKKMRRTIRRNVPSPSFRTSYFLSRAAIATIIPRALRTDIDPAGITLKVRKNLGINCAASRSETTSATTNPADLCSGINHAASKSSTP